MERGTELKPIAYIYTDFPEKFGIPRQSNLVEGLKGRIVFEPEYRRPEAFRGIEEYVPPVRLFVPIPSGCLP